MDDPVEPRPQIADLDAGGIAGLDKALALRGRAVRDDWVGAAKKLQDAKST